MRNYKKEIESLYQDFKKSNSINEENLFKILSDNKNTNIGLKYDFSNITSIKEYQKIVPITDASFYENGNEYVYDLDYKLVTSGTLGKQKRFSVSKESMNRSAGYNFIMPFYLLDIPTNKGINISYFRDTTKETLLSCALYDHLLKNEYFEINDWYDKDFLFGDVHQHVPYMKMYIALAHKDVRYFDAIFIYDILVVFNFLKDNYQRILHDIKTHTYSEDISESDKKILDKVVYTKERIEEIESILDGDFNKPFIKLLFPDLKFISGVGGGKYEIYDEAIKKYVGDTPIYFYIFAQTEATMGVPLQMNEAIYALIPKTCFYEFRDLNTDQILLPHELVIDNKYEIIATTFSGIYRYHTGDRVKFVGYQDETPLVKVEGRINSIINIGGEKVDDADITLTFNKLANDYSFGLFAVGIDRRIIPNRYIVFIDTNEDLTKLANSFDKELSKIAYDYYDLRQIGSINPPIAIKTNKERFINIQHGQIKPKVVLPDKIVKEWTNE